MSSSHNSGVVAELAPVDDGTGVDFGTVRAQNADGSAAVTVDAALEAVCVPIEKAMTCCSCATLWATAANI